MPRKKSKKNLRYLLWQRKNFNFLRGSIRHCKNIGDRARWGWKRTHPPLLVMLGRTAAVAAAAAAAATAAAAAAASAGS